MQKNARKPSTDPVQERLREDKAKWNKEVSLFVNDLIHLKKMMNGWPSKFHMERSFIKDPIPADPTTIIGSLAGDFNDIAQKGSAIVEEQLAYSKSRRKKQPKQLIQPSAAPTAPVAAPGPDLSEQLSVAFNNYSLVSEASNPITRFFTKLFNPTAGFGKAADIRRARIAMLEACAQGYKNLGKFQVEVVKSSAASVHNANAKLHECWTNWTLVSRAYALYKNSVSLKAPDKGGEIEQIVKEQDVKEEKELEKLTDAVQDFEKQTKEKTEEALDKTLDQNPESIPAPESELTLTPKSVDNPDLAHPLDPLITLEHAKNIAADYMRYSQFIPRPPGFEGYFDSRFRDAVHKFLGSKGKSLQPDYFALYQNVITDLNSQLGTSGSSYKEILSQLKQRIKRELTPPKAPKAKKPEPVPVAVVPPPAPLIEEVAPAEAVVTAFDKTSQDFIKKWVGKTLHQLSLFDKTSPYRLNCFKVAGEIRVELNQLMNELEKGLNPTTIEPLIKSINSKYLSLRGMMRSLNMAVGK